MRIGIDFDNTIVNYDGVFHAAAFERGLIPPDLPTGKNAVRDHLNGSGRKDDFTELQGYVYGARMQLASLYPSFVDFVRTARTAGHKLFVISHKTRHPILGPKYDMHAAARAFLVDNGLIGPETIPDDHVFFELTKEEKAARAVALDVDVFVDDLPEILALPGLSRMRRVLFDANGMAPGGNYDIGHSWAEIAEMLLRGPR